MSDTEMFKTKRGSFPLLNHTNYPTWAGNMKRYLEVIEGWEIATGQDIYEHYSTDAVGEADFLKREKETIYAIHAACIEEIKTYIDELNYADEMWETLKRNFDTTAYAEGRMQIYQEFMRCYPKPGESIALWFNKLMMYKARLTGTESAIGDVAFRTHLFTHLPASFEACKHMQMQRMDRPITTILDAIKAFETMNMLTTNPSGHALANKGEPQNQRTARTGQRGGRGSNAPRGTRGRASQYPFDGSKYCKYHDRTGHSSEECATKPGANNNRGGNPNRGGNSGASIGKRKTREGEFCYQCASDDHLASECDVRKKVDRKRRAASATGAVNATDGGAEVVPNH